ncbi:hypothetical protein [Rhizobium sp. Root482]|uniref:hypothetical protein n=1 Tax=Rhizobium sp. Root482 TaxID=1736543 RepID=UPI0006F237CD|nr:hypothetical protein [Rhizobium sp. Root482]KQY14436.1 hypothetical protein ASD31_09220 [Rhizobium sp. Root482]
MTINNTTTGIYSLTVNGKTYIGASQNLKSRVYHHKRDLHLNRHHVPAMQCDFNELNCGNSAISFSVLEYCNFDQLRDREQFHIDTKGPDYNIRAAGGGVRVITDEARENSRKRLTGKQMRYDGDFCTPFGVFPSSYQAATASDVPMSQPAIWNACKRPDTTITRSAYMRSRYLKHNHDESVIGKTWRELGFSFQPKADDDTGIKDVSTAQLELNEIPELSASERSTLIEKLKNSMANALDQVKQSASEIGAIIDASKSRLH